MSLLAVTDKVLADKQKHLDIFLPKQSAIKGSLHFWPKNLTELDEKLKKDDIEKCSKSQINIQFYGFIASTDVISDSLHITLLDEGGVRLYHSIAPKDIIYIDATGTVVENIAQFNHIHLQPEIPLDCLLPYL